MAFYGNITNTSKTTFQFDQTYSNRYEMDTRAGADGIFVGRYVLVDYDADLDKTSYILDAGNEHIYLYDNAEKPDQFNLYTEKPYFVNDAQGNILYTGPNHYAYYQFNKEVDDGRCLVLLPGHVLSNVSRTYKYFRVEEVVNSDTPGQYTIKVEETSVDKYLDYWQAQAEENKNLDYHIIVLDDTSYEPFTFYVYQDGKDGTQGEYVLCEDKEFNPKLDYYDFRGPDTDAFGVVNGVGLYLGEEFGGKGTIYRANPGTVYDINRNESQYWAIVDWTTGFRYVKNPEYDKSLEKEDDPTTWEFVEREVDIPIWGQLAAEKSEDATTGDLSIDFLPVKDGLNYNYEDDYAINLTIDRTYYGTSRGYDSTVWQKVYEDGRDKYVMVAELNSVVPSFDVEADAPTQVPLTPHFDPDSSNVYYRLHVQPSWGHRTKFADPTIQVPRINSNGQITSSLGSSRVDGDTYYPSDQTTTWESDFYDKYNDKKSHKIFNIKTNQWDDKASGEDNNIPAAIYFNKAGFDPKEIVYSSDLLEQGKPSFSESIAKKWKNVDRFEMTPTGHSGMLYDNHGFGTQTALSVDTQEFSVMLPSIGDTIAKIWDLVYGGRETNEAIYQTHYRNMDIDWEDARKGLDRHGLRMVGTEIFNGYNKAETNTLAGCINSVHDLMGMVISEMTASELAANLDELDEDYIYYIRQDKGGAPTGELALNLYERAGSFVMKQRSYKYTPVADTNGNEYDYVPVEKTDDNFDYTLYYVLEDGKYRPAKETDKGPFYAKTLVVSETFEEVSGKLTPFDGTLYYYNDGCSVDYSSETERLKMSDWVREPEYQAGRQYYEITPDMLTKVDVSQEFAPGKYYFKNEAGDYELSFEKEANPTIKYYVINTELLKDIRDYGYDNVYSPGVYFYRRKDGSFSIDTDDDGMWDADNNGVAEIVTHYEAIVKDNPDESTVVQQIDFQNEKGESKYNGARSIRFTQEMIENFDPSSYYVETQEKVMVQYNGPYNPNVEFWYKVVSLVSQPSSEIYTVGKEVSLTPYVKYAFYHQVKNSDGLVVKYEHLTAQVIREMVKNQSTDGIYTFGVIDDWDSTASGNIFDPNRIDTTDPTKYACQPQNVFYVPGLYHYVNGTDEYSDYVLDIYPTMWHKGFYYTFKTAPKLTNKTFYEPYKYYYKNGDEYLLIKDFLDSESIKDFAGNIYKKETFYVYEDTSGIFQKGSEWNPNVTVVPPTVTLARRSEITELRTLEGFARDLNTIHGLILQVNRMMLMNDKFTRDQRTLQGSINLLNDKIAQFGRMAPNEVMVVDNYGRTQGAKTFTAQDKTADLIKGTGAGQVPDSNNTGILADRYPIAANVEAMRDQWITINVDGAPSNPKFTIHHNFQPVSNVTKSILDLNSPAVDQFNISSPIVDKMGHVVGTTTQPIKLPFGFKYFTTNGVSNETFQLTTATETVSADNTQDTFSINSGNKWIRMATSAANDTLTIAHETHSLTTTEISEVTDLDDSQTFAIQDMKFDAAGHITHNQKHTYRLPDGFKFVAIGEASNETTMGLTGAGTLEADNQIAKFTINPNNRWITLQANATNDILSIGHAYAGDDSGRVYGDASAQTPNFGATFKVPYFGVDAAGHVKTQSEHTVTIPLPSLTEDDGDVVTGLTLVPEEGKFTVAKTNVGKLTISDFLLGEDGGAISNTDSINTAFAKLQVQMNAEVEARQDAILNLEYEDATVEEDDNMYVHSVTQEAGKIEVVRKQLGTAALKAEEDFILKDQIFKYEVPDEIEDEEVLTTIEWLFAKVAALEARIAELENPESTPTV